MLRVGSVPYVVGRPLDSGLESERGIELTFDVPARLIRGLRDGSLDVALVSSIELFRRPGYSYIDGLAVSGRGYVSSVQVFLKRRIEDVRRIALDPASRTAATLTRIVWPEGTARPEFVEVAETADPRQTDADAWLRIGDRALTELWEPEPPAHFNPSQAWNERTGLPFIFAPWIVRPGIDIEPFAAAFLRAFERGRSEARELATREALRHGWPTDRAVRYLTEECTFDPGADLGPALREFRDRAAELGLADGALDPGAIVLART